MAAQVPATIQLVQFYDDTIRSWKDVDGKIYVVMRDPIKALHLSIATQLKMIQEDELFEGFTRCTAVNTPGGRQEMLGLDHMMLPMWLARIESTRVKPERKPKLLRYQRECAKVLADYWQGRSLIDQIVLPGYRSYEPEYSWLFAARVEHLYGRSLLPGATYPLSTVGFIDRYIRSVLPKPARVEIRQRNPRNARGNRALRDHQLLTKDALEKIERKRRDTVWALMNEHETIRDFEKALRKHDRTLSETEGTSRHSLTFRIPEVSWQYELPLDEL